MDLLCITHNNRAVASPTGGVCIYVCVYARVYFVSSLLADWARTG